MIFDWGAFLAAIPDVLQGLKLTIVISIAGLGGAIALGTLAVLSLLAAGLRLLERSLRLP